eukprot:1136427-Pelagomonas_calceolata.AAC.1
MGCSLASEQGLETACTCCSCFLASFVAGRHAASVNGKKGNEVTENHTSSALLVAKSAPRLNCSRACDALFAHNAGVLAGLGGKPLVDGREKKLLRGSRICETVQFRVLDQCIPWYPPVRTESYRLHANVTGKRPAECCTLSVCVCVSRAPWFPTVAERALKRPSP